MPAQELSLGITLAVLGAGLLHASWNAMLKSAPGGDPMLDTASVVAGSSVCALVLLPFAGVPGPAAWKFIAGVVGRPFRLLHHARHAYRTGDLSFAYPLMRGTAPLLVDGARHRVPARVAHDARRRRHRADLRRHRQHRVRAARSSPARCSRVGVRQRRDHRGLHADRRRRRARIRQRDRVCHVADLPRRTAVPRLDCVAARPRPRSRTYRAAGAAACSAARAASPPTASCCSR